ncbi:hypothetical protein JCM8208_004989 [Rhodotorula glutinis]
MSGSDTQHLLSILRGSAAGPPPPSSSQAPGPTAAPRPPRHGQPGAQAPSQDPSGSHPGAPLATTDSLLALFSRHHPSSADSPQQPSPQPRTAQEISGSMHQHHQSQAHAPTSPMTRRSSDLLSLLQGTHASPAQLQQDQAAGSSHVPTNGDAPTSPPGGNASQLLGLLMSGGGGGPGAAHNGTSTAEQASPTSTRPPPLSSVPSHVRTLSPASGSDTSEATTSATALAPGRPASAAGDGPISHAHLAAQYLVPDAPPPLGAPIGLRLPRSAHPPREPQHLSISLSDAHVEALAPSLPPTTPITLFALPVSFPGARRAAGTWERGIAYATGGGKGRVRVIDRESGARVLLKGAKGGDVRELRVAPYAVEGRRRVATVAEDGAVAVWEVADSFESEDEARVRRLRDLDLPPSGSLVRFSPDNSAQTVAIVDSSSTIHVISLDGSVKPRQLDHDGDIADLTYSADGKLLAVVDRTGRYTVYSVENHQVERSGSVPLVDGAEVDQVALLEPAQGDGHAPVALAVSSQQGAVVSIVSLDQAGEASDITFSAPPGTANAWGALAYHRATQSLLVSHSLRGSIYAFRLTFAPGTSQGVRIEHVVEQPTTEPVLSFVLDPLASADPHAAGPSSSSTAVDSDVPPSSATSSSPPLPQLSFGALVLHPRGVSHIGLVGSVPRPPSRPPTPSTAGTVTDDDDEPHLAAMATAAGRRMSLEGSIYVASEVSVRVDEPETDELSLKVALPAVSSPSPLSSPSKSAEPRIRDAPPCAASSFGSYSLSPPRAAEPALGDLGNGISGARTPVAEAPSGSASAGPGASSSPNPLFNVGGGGGGGERIRLAGPVVNAAIRSMKARQQHAASSSSVALASPGLSPIASAPTSVSGGDSGSEREQGQKQGADKEKRREARGQHGEAGGRDLRRLESSLPSKVVAAVSRELDKHFQQLEQHSTAAVSASTSRDQSLLAAVQQSVAATVTRVIEGTLLNQVGGVVEQAVRAQMGRTVEEVITRALPLELEKQLNRPALSFALSSSIATTIAPPLERHLTGTLIKHVVPALEQKLSDAVAGVVGSIHREMVGVRKEIVQEQSGAVGILEDEVASLRQEVSTLKAMMEQMHALVLRQSNEARSAAPSASPRVPQQPPSLAQLSPRHPHPHQHQQYLQRHVSQPFVSAAPPPPAAVVAATSHPRSDPSSTLPVALHALPPIPRVATPPERYEELFTEAMQPQHEPSFVSLQHLVASSPLSRIDAVFPPPPALPKISMAVVLSLAYRLSQVVADRQGPLDDEGKKLLLWLRKAIAACDGKQPPDLLALIPRILTNVVDNLVVRGRTLMALQDLAGANDVRLVQQYAHARLSLFAQPGAGEGFEQFRR